MIHHRGTNSRDREWLVRCGAGAGDRILQGMGLVLFNNRQSPMLPYSTFLFDLLYMLQMLVSLIIYPELCVMILPIG